MNYLILAETEFFGLINEAGNDNNLATAYDGFVKAVISLCHECTDRDCADVALAYTENELQHHDVLYSTKEKSRAGLYVRKALSFVRKMQKQTVSNHAQVPPLSAPNDKVPQSPSVTRTFRWTGNAVDLIEIVYGLDEMGCINNGDVPIGELAAFFYDLLGVEAKACYRFYTDIKHRKNESRTYFLDKMQERLNERMRRDDEREMQRK